MERFNPCPSPDRGRRSSIQTLLAGSLMLGSCLLPVSAAELILHWDAAPEDESAQLQTLSNQLGLELEHRRALHSAFTLVSVEGESDSAIALLSDSGQFRHVEPVRTIAPPKPVVSEPIPQVKGDTPPIGTFALPTERFNDPLYPKQYYLDEQLPGFWGLSNMAEARAYAEQHRTLERKVRIAILDTGAWPHEDMQWSSDQANMVADGYRCRDSSALIDCPSGNLERMTRSNDAIDKQWQYDSFEGKYTPYVDGHGLAVASQIGAISDNGLGMVGNLSHQMLELVPVRVLGATGGSTIDIADGIRWVSGQYAGSDLAPISAPVDVINMSLGAHVFFSCEAESYLYEAIQAAKQQGISVVAAVGNEEMSADWSTPSYCDGVVAVGSNHIGGDLSSFSNYGAAVDVTMAGEGITTAYVSTDLLTDPDCGQGAEGCYGFSTGTSMSTPNVASVLGMLKLVHPELSAEEREAMLYQTARPFDTTTQGIPSRAAALGAGHGVVNALAALKSADPLDLSGSQLYHRHADFDTPAQQQYLLAMQSHLPRLCDTIDVELGWLEGAVAGIHYELVLADGDLASAPVAKQSSEPKLALDTQGFARMGVRACRDSSCGALTELPLASVAKPSLCQP